jgi:hypothetical protein
MTHTNTILLTFTLLAAAGLPAQEDPRPDARPRDQKQTNFQARDQVALSDVLGAKVRLNASAEERGEAAAEQRAPDRPNGSIDDLVIDAHSGCATWAIVSVGGMLGIGDKEVAVPATALTAARTADEAPVYHLAATEAELKALPAFDKDVLKKSGLDVALRNAETSWNKVRPGGDRRPVDASGKRRDLGVEGNGNGHTGLAQAVLGSQLDGMAVRTSDAKEGKDFGEVESACLDLQSHTVSFLVVGHGGVVGIGETKYLVPFRATRTVLTGDDRKPALTLAKTTAEMESATKYTKPDKAFLADENARASCAFFGVEHTGAMPGKLDKDLDKGRTDKGKGDGR